MLVDQDGPKENATRRIISFERVYCTQLSSTLIHINSPGGPLTAELRCNASAARHQECRAGKPLLVWDTVSLQ